jgi:integrase/recombinase XerD
MPAAPVGGWESVAMTDFPCLVRWVARSGEARYRLGHPVVDRYLEFVAGRARPNTLRAVAFDLKAFFTVVAEGPGRCVRGRCVRVPG